MLKCFVCFKRLWFEMSCMNEQTEERVDQVLGGGTGTAEVLLEPSPLLLHQWLRLRMNSLFVPRVHKTK